MNSKYWLIYVVLYIAFSVWSLLKLNELNVPHIFSISDVFSLIMLASIIGLAFQIKLINKFIWQKISWVSILFLIHAWVIMPMVYLSDKIEWKSIAFIQLFAIPSLPLFIGLFLYAWRSPEIWNKTPNKAIKMDV